jgi:hypothetical protein
MKRVANLKWKFGKRVASLNVNLKKKLFVSEVPAETSSGKDSLHNEVPASDRVRMIARLNSHDLAAF